MIKFLLRRVLLFAPTLVAISIVTFVLIQLPPGDYLTSYLLELEQSGQEVSDELVASLKHRYRLDLPVYVQYFKWVSNIILHGDFGRSMQWNRPVADLIRQRLSRTVAISFATLIVIWLLAFPIGIYSFSGRN